MGGTLPEHSKPKCRKSHETQEENCNFLSVWASIYGPPTFNYSYTSPTPWLGQWFTTGGATSVITAGVLVEAGATGTDHMGPRLGPGGGDPAR